jgi:multicomponent Na+:H+ antiporter subunit C
MQTLLALLAGVLFATGIYLVLRRSLLRIIFGLILLSNAVNLVVFSMGRIVRAGPPLVPLGMQAPVEAYTNPLPQALVLTAIVIGFALVAFALVLAYRAYASLGLADAEDIVEGTDGEPGDAHLLDSASHHTTLPAEVKA